MLTHVTCCCCCCFCQTKFIVVIKCVSTVGSNWLIAVHRQCFGLLTLCKGVAFHWSSPHKKRL
jgi:hypothetical protein